MIISIRGTHGSGKSSVMKALLASYDGAPLFGRLGAKKPEAYELKIEGVGAPVYILGPYANACGGCDAVQPYDIILDLLTHYAARGHVLFEGALVSSSYGRIGRLMEQWGRQSVFAFLPTPVEECLRRITVRRLARGDERPLNPKNTEGKHRSIESSRKQVTKAGVLRMVDLDWERPVEGILTLLREANAPVAGVDQRAGIDPAVEGPGPTGPMDSGSNPGQVSFL